MNNPMIEIDTYKIEKAISDRIDVTLLFLDHKTREYVEHRAAEYFLKWNGKRDQRSMIIFPLLSARIFFSIWDLRKGNNDKYLGRRSLFFVYPELKRTLLINGYDNQVAEINQLNYRYDQYGYT